jgi:ribosomal-protein-alanine N-acetyltransferase
MVDDDLDRVLELEHAIFPNPWRRSFFRADIGRQQGLCIVADDGGQVVGYAVAWGTDEVHLANLAVAPEARRGGVGRTLMAEVLRYAASVGAASVYLEVRVSNAAARSFYAAHGFVPTFTRKGYYENGEDALIMERDVEPAQQ